MTAQASRRRRSGFSLIEIIAVLSIVTILVTASAPYVNGMLSATRLRTAADEVYNKLLEAQSLAILFNTEAELRLYEVPDLIDDSSRPTLRKLRVLVLQPPEAGTSTPDTSSLFEPVGAVTHLEAGVEVNPTPVHSSIVDLGFAGPENEKEAGRHVAVRFRSDGSVGLQAGKPWFLTLHEKDAHLRGDKLKNFITIQIDPATGRLRTFQP